MTSRRSDTVERLFREEAPKLWRSLVGFAGDREIASDAVAEAFAQLLGRGDQIRSPDRWVWRAAFKIARGELKERETKGAVEREAPYELPEPPSDLVRALRSLSPNQRAAAILRFYIGYSTREIGQILGSSPATVRVHLSLARKRLRAALEVDDV